RSRRVDSGGLVGETGGRPVRLHPVPGGGGGGATIRYGERSEVFGGEGERHFRARRGGSWRPQGLAADEGVVERDRPAVAQFPWGGVVVLDVGRVEASVEGALALDAEQRQPPAVVRQVRVGVDGRDRRGNPAALHARAGVGPGADLDEAELLP